MIRTIDGYKTVVLDYYSTYYQVNCIDCAIIYVDMSMGCRHCDDTRSLDPSRQRQGPVYIAIQHHGRSLYEEDRIQSINSCGIFQTLLQDSDPNTRRVNAIYL